MPSRVLIALGRRVCRDGLRQALATWPEFEVVGETGDGSEVTAIAAKAHPDLVITEATLPGLNGAGVARQVATELSGVRVLVMCAHADWEFVTGAMRAGATACVLTEGGLAELRRALDAVVKGETYMSPAAERIVISSLDRLATDGAIGLSPREGEVLQLLAEGMSTKRIAEALSVSVKTVETHRRQIMEKLGIRSVAGLTKFAIRHGITSVNG
jgi:DNA-binding NarL/FixJ family response regulator